MAIDCCGSCPAEVAIVVPCIVVAPICRNWMAIASYQVENIKFTSYSLEKQQERNRPKSTIKARSYYGLDMTRGKSKELIWWKFALLRQGIASDLKIEILNHLCGTEILKCQVKQKVKPVDSLRLLLLLLASCLGFVAEIQKPPKMHHFKKKLTKSLQLKWTITESLQNH